MRKENPNFFKKTIASLVTAAALNSGIAFASGPEEGLFASPVATVVATNELDTRSEVVSREQKRQAIFHIGSPVYISTNPAAGEMNVLKKSDVAPRIVDGRTLLVVRPVAEATGALVSWDEKTETASLVKDGKTVRIKKNSYTLEIEDSSGIRYVEMDIPAQIIDGRFVLPVRFIIEALGDTVIWDEETRAVYVGYTQEEVDSFKGAWRQENEPMDALKNPENMYEVFEYMAGGEFADFIAFSNVIINEETSSAKIVFSNEDSKRVDPLAHAVLDGTTYTLKDLDREYLKQSGVDKIVGELKKGDVVFVKDGEFIRFSSSREVKVYSKDGAVDKVSFTGFSFYKPEIKYDNDYGVVATDGHRITHKYDLDSKQWVELVDYKIIATPEQWIIKSLQRFHDVEFTNLYGKIVKNTFNLDQGEIDRYKNTLDDRGNKTFKVVKDGQGRPAFGFAIGKESGLPEYESLFMTSMTELNGYDPDLIRYLVDVNGVDFVGTMNFANNDVIKYYLATYFWQKDMGAYVVVNRFHLQAMESMKYVSKEGHDISFKETFQRIVGVESRGIKGRKRLDNNFKLIGTDVLSYDEILDKTYWFANLIEKLHKENRIPEDRYNDWKDSVNSDLEFYRQRQNSKP